MIRSFVDKRTANIFNGGRERSFPATLVKRARSNLDRINYAANINDLHRVTTSKGLRVTAKDSIAFVSRAVGVYALSGEMEMPSRWN